MLKKLIICVMCIYFNSSWCQVGIGTETPSSSSILDIVAANSGVLLPRVALSSLENYKPVKENPEESLIVYNKTKNEKLTPGFYYWNSNRWEKILSDTDIIENATTTSSLKIEENQLYFKNEKGEVTIIPFMDVVKEFESSSELTYDIESKSLVFKNAFGEISEFPLKDLITNEETTSTLLVKDQTIINYINEEGVKTEFDINAVNNIDLSENNELIITKKNGDSRSISLSDIVKDSESTTTLELKDNNILSYIDEKGNVKNIDINSIESININNNSELIIEDKKGNVSNVNLKNVVKENESITTFEKDENERYYYKNEKNEISYLNINDTNGAVSASITVQENDYTAGENDYTIVFNNKREVLLSLPNPSTCKGRLHFLINNGEDIVNLNQSILSGYGNTTNILTPGLGSSGSMIYGNRMLIQSDGIHWIILQN